MSTPPIPPCWAVAVWMARSTAPQALNCWPNAGEAKITKGYRLPAKFVIHTVGPVWHGGKNGEKELLTACYRNSLDLALSYDCETVAFPMISAGAYGYPKDQAMAVAVDAITHFLFEHDMTVYLVVFGQTEFLTGKKLFRDVQEYIDDVYAAGHTDQNLSHARQQLWRRDEKAAAALDQELGSVYSDAASGYGPPSMAPAPEAARPLEAPGIPDLDALLRRTDKGFSETLLDLIDQRGMTDAECYKKANVDRKLFSKIRSNPAYRPSKPTVFAFAVSLELSLPETRMLLRKAGFALSHSSKFDIVMEYFIRSGYYNIFEINEVLFHYDMPLLGSGTA